MRQTVLEWSLPSRITLLMNDDNEWWWWWCRGEYEMVLMLVTNRWRHKNSSSSSSSVVCVMKVLIPVDASDNCHKAFHCTHTSLTSSALWPDPVSRGCDTTARPTSFSLVATTANWVASQCTQLRSNSQMRWDDWCEYAVRTQHTRYTLL